MFFSTLTLRFNPDQGEIDDQRFQEFVKDKDVISVKEHFFLYRELPHLTLCVSWRQPEAGSRRINKPDETWRNLLKTPEDEELFDRLRRWRAEKAGKDGIPAYAIMTNVQLAEMAANKPRSKAALGTIKGFGPARADKFAADLLALMGVK
ncbi:MAG: HRDC domain-containing protein [Planctomycetota bacterium]